MVGAGRDAIASDGSRTQRAYAPFGPCPVIEETLSLGWAAIAVAGLVGLTWPAVLERRQHWLLALQRQVDAAEALAGMKSRTPAGQRKAASARLGAAFQRRCDLEACLDAACSRTLRARSQA